MKQKRRFFNVALVLALAYTTIIFMGCAAAPPKANNPNAADVKASLFMEANTAWHVAQAANAKLLAPKNYAQGVEFYQTAQSDLKNQKSLNDIRENLRKSTAAFDRTIQAVKLAEVTFPTSIKARQDAITSESSKYSPEKWAVAESKFNKAASTLENGDVNSAKSNAREAEDLYRDAELYAIKIRYLNETLDLIKKADKLGVKEYAPKTLAQATQLFKQAEKEINENRYDIDVARNLAFRAKHGANKSIYLTATIKQAKEKNLTWEDMLLNAEVPLQRISEQTGRYAYFDDGYALATNQIIYYINTYRDSLARASQELDWLTTKTKLQESRISELELSLVSQEKQQKIEVNKMMVGKEQQKSEMEKNW